MTVTVEPVDAPLGALVKGVDLSVPLDDPASRELVKDWILFVHGVYRNLISVMRFLLGGTPSPRRIA